MLFCTFSSVLVLWEGFSYGCIKRNLFLLYQRSKIIWGIHSVALWEGRLFFCLLLGTRIGLFICWLSSSWMLSSWGKIYDTLNVLKYVLYKLSYVSFVWLFILFSCIFIWFLFRRCVTRKIYCLSLFLLTLNHKKKSERRK